MAKHLFTSESVTEGHPDKICDQISDAVLDAILEQDPMARVACETVTTTGMVLCMGEISTKAYVDIPGIARSVIQEIGYDRAKYGFDASTCSVLTAIDEQSPDIAMGVNDALESRATDEHETGAGDQGMMFGFACDETSELMPLPISLAHKLTMKLAAVRKEKKLRYLRPDGKAQVTVEYDGYRPVRVDTVVVSTQHAPEIPSEQIAADIMTYVIRPVIPAELLDMTNKSDTFTEEIDLLQYLPDNVQLVDLADSVVAVTVDIEPEISKKIEMRESRIHVTNLPDGFTASVSGVEETFIIEVIGLAQDLSEVQASSLEGTVDINDLMEKFSLEELQEGFYTMEVSFGLPDDVRLLEPVEVVVHISAKQE